MPRSIHHTCPTRKSNWLRRPLLRCALVLALALPALGFIWPFTGYTQTKYPIVLVHGLLGFDTLIGVVEYWWDIPAALERSGARVFVTETSGVNSSTARGEQLLAQVEEILAITGATKVNLIGHSQGGLDARYVASVRSDLVASVTTVATPHQGASGLASLLSGDASTQGLALDLLEGLGSLLQLLGASENPLDAEALAAELSTEGIQAFNAAHPSGLPATACGEGAYTANGIRNYSWTGTARATHPADLLDIMFVAAGLFADEAENDGLVGRCSSHFGKVIRDNYFHNHLDEVNLMFGLVPIFEQDPKAIYRIHANRLKNAGL